MWTPLIEVKTVCPLCADEKTFVMQKKKHDEWRAGALIQDVLPQIPYQERERLISGTCPKCWNAMCAMFKKEDDDEEN